MLCIDSYLVRASRSLLVTAERKTEEQKESENKKRQNSNGNGRMEGECNAGKDWIKSCVCSM